ncbi:MAG: hypothetical protein QXP38_00010 [Nitrososphaerota archaeon]
MPRRRRRSAHPVIVIAIIMMLMIPLAYFGSQYLFTTLWQGTAGPAELSLSVNDAPVDYKELVKAGSKSLTFVFSAQASGSNLYKASMLQIGEYKLSYSFPEISFNLPPNTKLFLPFWIIYDGGGYYPSETTTTSRTTTTTTQVCIAYSPSGYCYLTTTTSTTTQPTTQSPSPTTTQSPTTTTRPPTTTQSPTTTQTLTPTTYRPSLKLEGAGWSEVRTSPDMSGVTGYSNPIKVEPYEVLTINVVVRHVEQLGARVIIYLQRESGGSYGAESQQDFNLQPGETKSVTLVSHYGRGGNYRVAVSIVADRYAPSVVAASYSYSKKSYTDQKANDVSVATINIGEEVRGYVSAWDEDRYTVQIPTYTGDYKFCLAASDSRVKLTVQGFGSTGPGKCLILTKTGSTTFQAVIIVSATDITRPASYVIKVYSPGMTETPLTVTTPQVPTETTFTTTLPVASKQYFHAMRIEKVEMYASGKFSTMAGSKSSVKPISPTGSSSISTSVNFVLKKEDAVSGGYIDIALEYIVVEVSVYGSGPSTPTTITIDELADRGFSPQLTVDVPVGGSVTTKISSYGKTVRVGMDRLVVIPPSPFTIRNVVTNVNDWSVTFEIVNNLGEPAEFSVTYPAFVANPSIHHRVQVPAVSSATVKMYFNNYVTDAMISKAQTDPNYRIKFTIGVELQSLLYSDRRQSFEAIFNVLRIPAKFSVSTAGPGTVYVFLNGIRVGGPGTYDGYVGDEVTIEAVPSGPNDFLCSFEARDSSGKYLRYEPCDVFVMSGDKLLPKKWTLILPEGGFTASLGFKSITDPEVLQHRSVGTGWLDLSERVRIVGKGEVVESKQYLEDGVEYIDARVKAVWTINNDWDFPVTAVVKARVTSSQLLSIQYVSMPEKTVTIPAKSSIAVEWELTLNKARILERTKTDSSLAAAISVAGEVSLSSDKQVQINEAGKTYVVKPSGGMSLPTTTFLWPIGGGYGGAYTQTGNVYAADGSGRTIITGGGTSQMNMTVYEPTGLVTSYNEVPLNYNYKSSEAVLSKDGEVIGKTTRQGSGTITAVEAPPAADLKNVKLGAPVVQPQLKKGWLESIWESIVNFFKMIWDFFSQSLGGGRGGG